MVVFAAIVFVVVVGADRVVGAVRVAVGAGRVDVGVVVVIPG